MHKTNCSCIEGLAGLKTCDEVLVDDRKKLQIYAYDCQNRSEWERTTSKKTCQPRPTLVKGTCFKGRVTVWPFFGPRWIWLKFEYMVV